MTKDAITEAGVEPRPERARIIGLIVFRAEERYADQAAFRADASAHRIKEGGSKDWDGSGDCFAWPVQSVRRVQPFDAPKKKGQIMMASHRFSVEVML